MKEHGIKNIISLYGFNIGNKVLQEESPRRKRKHDFVYHDSFKMRYVPGKIKEGRSCFALYDNYTYTAVNLKQ